MASPARLSATRRIGYPAAPAVDFLGELGAAGRARVLEGSARVTFPPGTVLFQIGDPHYAVIVEAGLLRTFRSTPDGRQSTMSYLHARELFGATGSLGVALTAHLQVVSQTTLIRLDSARLQRLVLEELEVARAIATVLASYLSHAFRIIGVRSLGSVRERLAYDLMDRCCVSQLESGDMCFAATHANLADAVGTTRESISRALAKLRNEGAVATTPGLIRVADPMRLGAIVRGLVS